MSSVPIWIKFPNLPVSLWKETFLSKICHQIGKPLMADLLTTKREVWGYAIALVEVDLSKPLIENIEINLSTGMVIKQKVIYERLPLFCTTCKQLGHADSLHQVSKPDRMDMHSSSLAWVPKSVGGKKSVHFNDTLANNPTNAAGTVSEVNISDMDLGVQVPPRICSDKENNSFLAAFDPPLPSGSSSGHTGPSPVYDLFHVHRLKELEDEGFVQVLSKKKAKENKKLGVDKRRQDQLNPVGCSVSPFLQ